MNPLIAGAVVIAATLSGCASAAEAPALVTVSFGSEAMGIDGAAFASIQRVAETSALVKSHEIKAWGREGEQTVTLTAQDAAAAKDLLAEVKAALPDKLAKGYVTVTGPDGASFRVGNK